MATRTNFSFRFEWSEKIAHLSETVQYHIFIGTVAYAKHGEFPADAPAEARAAFDEYILPDFIKRAKAAEYRARAKARKAAAALAAAENPEAPTNEAPAQNPPVQSTPEQAAPTLDTPEQTTPTPETPATLPLEAPRLSRSARRRLARKQKKLKLLAGLQKQ